MRFSMLLSLVACGGSPGESAAPTPAAPGRDPTAFRVMTWNVSMFRDQQGQLASDLADPANAQAVGVATVLQELRPDVLLLNELDHDADGTALRLLREGFLAVSQAGGEPLVYEHALAPEVNTGVASGFDLNNDGTTGGDVGTREYGDDAWGFGEFPGKYGFAVLSRFPITEVRTFQSFVWADMDDPQLPDGWFDAEEAAAMRLSSKNHADVVIDVNGADLHFLVSHPTPPGFDGAEDRNGLRNRAEVHFWADYLDGDPTGYHVDDDGRRGGIGAGAFVVAGDLNIDAVDGERTGGIQALLGHPRVVDPAPTSAGGAAAASQGGANDRHRGDPALDTADFSDGSVGNLRADYVLPSTELQLEASGVLWPLAGEPLDDLVNRRISDHHPVWIDVTY